MTLPGGALRSLLQKGLGLRVAGEIIASRAAVLSWGVCGWQLREST